QDENRTFRGAKERAQVVGRTCHRGQSDIGPPAPRGSYEIQPELLCGHPNVRENEGNARLALYEVKRLAWRACRQSSISRSPDEDYQQSAHFEFVLDYEHCGRRAG